MKWKIIAGTLLLSLWSMAGCWGKVIYVNISGTGTGPATSGFDGTSIRDLQVGLDSAMAGDSVLVTAGQYSRPQGRSLEVPEGVYLEGGYEKKGLNGSWGLYYGAITILEGSAIPGSTLMVIESGSTTLPTTIIGFKFLQNRSWNNGGAILMSNDLETTVIEKCHFEENSSEYGGGIFAAGNQLVLRDCEFWSNSADFEGGAIYASQLDYLEVENVDFITNETTYRVGNGRGGGAIALYNADSFSIDSSFFSLNTAAAAGGAILASNFMTADISSSTFSRNESQRNGGAIMDSNFVAIEINNSIFSLNQSGKHGGAILASDFMTAEVNNSTFNRNHARDNGGALFVQVNDSVLLYGNDFSCNRSDRIGGAIFGENKSVLSQGKLISVANIFTENDAKLIAGAISSGLDNFFLNCISTRNISTTNIFDITGSAQFYFCTFFDDQQKGNLFDFNDSTISFISFSAIIDSNLGDLSISLLNSVISERTNGADPSTIIIPDAFLDGDIFFRPNIKDLRPADHSPLIDRVDPSSVNFPPELSSYSNDPRTLGKRSRKKNGKPVQGACGSRYDVGAFERQSGELDLGSGFDWVSDTISVCVGESFFLPFFQDRKKLDPPGLFRISYTIDTVSQITDWMSSRDSLAILPSYSAGEIRELEISSVEFSGGCKFDFSSLRMTLITEPINLDFKCTSDTILMAPPWNPVPVEVNQFAPEYSACGKGVPELIFPTSVTQSDIDSTIPVLLLINTNDGGSLQCTTSLTIECQNPPEAQIDTVSTSFCVGSKLKFENDSPTEDSSSYT